MKMRELYHVQTLNIVFGRLLGVCAFTVLMCFSALIKIPLPFTPVPVTLQTLVVFLAGALLGPSLAVCAIGLYIGMGLFGIPLFANMGGGIPYLFGPTGGYLFGFLIAAWLIGNLTPLNREKNIFVFYAITLAGMLAIYSFGGLWLKVGYGWNFNQIFFLGVAPFFIPDTFKAFIAAAIYKNL